MTTSALAPRNHATAISAPVEDRFKTFIQNRRGLRLSVLVEGANNTGGLVFFEHGFTGYKEQVQFEALSALFLKHNYTVVRFDTSSSFGESEGDLWDSNITTHYQDLEDVTFWARRQDWYIEPFVLLGHSLGGIAVLNYTIHHPQSVKAIAPLSTAVSYEFWHEAMLEHRPHILLEFATRGYSEKTCNRDSSRTGKWGMAYGLEYLKYDIPAGLPSITVPTLLALGSEDVITPRKQQEYVRDHIGGSVSFHIIDGAPHTFREPAHLDELVQVTEAWLNAL